MADARPPLNVRAFTVTTLRRCAFVCWDAADHAELTAEFPPVAVGELYSFPIRRRTQSVQAAGGFNDGSTQTFFNYPRHATTQYEARQFSQQEVEQHISSNGFLTFLSKASLRVERTLVENILLNPFNDHVDRLKSSDGEAPLVEPILPPFSGRSGRPPRRLVHHSELCDGKFVTCLHSHPTLPGILAAGYAAKTQLEDRQAYWDSSRLGRHFVLLWKTSKSLIEPMMILEAADDILAVQFSNQHAFTIAASCHSGMLLVWDLTAYAHLFKGVSTNLLMSGLKKAFSAPAVTPAVVPAAATLENYPCQSRRIQWTPGSVEFTTKGPVGIMSVKLIHQLFTCYDGFMIVWDVKLADEAEGPSNMNLPQMPSRVKPVFKMFPVVNDKRRDVAVTSFAFLDLPENKKTQGRMADVAVYPPICIAGTEEGEIFIVDWRLYAETERGAACTASLCIAFHDGPVTDILPAPHISNTVLSVGGRIWAIWRSTDMRGPVLELPPRPAAIQSAAWSPWQSSVVAVGLANGVVEVWDILHSTARPQRQIRISKSAITALEFGRDGSGPFICIADADGAGKITLLPFPTENMNPNMDELKRIEAFMEAETRHRMAMNQLHHHAPVSPSDETPITHRNAPTMPFTDSIEYFKVFTVLEQKIKEQVQEELHKDKRENLLSTTIQTK